MYTIDSPNTVCTMRTFPEVGRVRRCPLSRQLIQQGPSLLSNHKQAQYSRQSLPRLYLVAVGSWPWPLHEKKWVLLCMINATAPHLLQMKSSDTNPSENSLELPSGSLAREAATSNETWKSWPEVDNGVGGETAGI